jgi:hypothetical protein
MVLEGLEVGVVELAGEHGEEPPEAVGAEAGGVLVGDVPQPLEHAHEELQHLHGPAEDGVR